MTVSGLLERNNNNLDLIRIVAAMMVIIGHSYFLADSQGKTDPINSIFEFTYSGSLAVKIFFFVSGLLVTNSLISSQSVMQFLISRFFRIYPAFAATIIITAYVLGPFVTNMTIENYLSSKWLDYYVLNNLLMQINYNLPGLFGDNIHKLAVNGSLWTIPYEIKCYVVLLSVFMTFGVMSKRLLSAFCVLVILAPVLDYNELLFINSKSAEAYMLPPCFAFGALYAINKDAIRVGLAIPSGLFILHLSVNDTDASIILFYFSVCALTLYISGIGFVKKIKIKHDISYGVYLWGFVVQQTIYNYLPSLNIHLNQLIALISSCILGYLSFIFIEKPAIKFGKLISSTVKINSRCNRTAE